MKKLAGIQLFAKNGRNFPILSGYRPNLYIDEDNQSDCVITLLETGKCYPGQFTTVTIEIMFPHLIKSESKSFYLREGNKIVAIGTFL